MRHEKRGTPGPRRLRVALDTTYAGRNPTGVGLYSRRIVEHLARRAHELRLDITCHGPACRATRSAPAFVDLMQEWPTHQQVLLPIGLLRTQPHMVHSTSHIGPLWGPGKRIITIHDLIFLRFPEEYNRAWLAIARLLLPLALRRASAVVADSHATKNEVMRHFGTPSGKIAVVYPGVDQGTFTQIAAQQEPAKRPFLLCLGPWVSRKNLTMAAQAFARVADHHPELRLVITGEPTAGMRGYDRATLARAAGKHSSRVEFTGYVARDELSALLAEAAILLYPSRLEGFGLPPLEAMAAGLPVIASRNPAVAEVTGGAAILCDQDDAAEWASQIERLLDSPRLAQELGAQGQLRSARFTWDATVEHLASLYHAVARTRRASG